MLASDSDSEFEYPADGGNQSDASDDCVLLGKLALGIDPQDMRSYDGRSTPRNGSQYLMKVMAEKKAVPKVVSADAALLSRKLSEKRDEGQPVAAPQYLDRFLQVCEAGDVTDSSIMNFLPTSKWREETLACFSLMRTRVEKWQYKIEAQDIRIVNPIDLPQGNDNTHWIKFCFGDCFQKLSAGSKSKTKEQRLSDFFLDLYDTEVIEVLKKRFETAVEKLPEPVNQEENNDISTEVDESIELVNDDTAVSSDVLDETLDETPPSQNIMQLGHRPLMNLMLQLNQNQLEKLVKWNLLWVKNIGFVNECQGQWLYAVLACLFKPVDPSVMSDLRSIVRALIKIRNKFSEDWGAHFETKDEEENHERFQCDERVFDFINTLNLFIYIIADYFQQKDLVMVL